MSQTKYKVTIEVDKLKKPHNFEFGRINILLGANGTGKSAVLNKIKSSPHFFSDRTDIAFIEGGRTLSIPATLAMDRNNLGFSTLHQAENQHKSKRLGKLSERIKDALFALDRKGDLEYRNHSEAVELWEGNGSKDKCPKRNETPLSELCRIFKGVFPEIELKFDPQSKGITCSKNGSPPYAPDGLSDGEKQVFCMIADLLLISHGNPLIIVDEPELNLHPSLAIDLWHLIEGALDKGVFIYATHSVGFALRKDIDSLYVLPRTGSEAIPVTDIALIDREELKAYLGAIPSILANPKVLAVEGDKSSLDAAVYRWIVGDDSIAVEAVGACNNVVSAIKRDGIWKTIGESQTLIGIIDRDFKSDSCIAKLGIPNIHVLPFHEIESVLAIPSLVNIVATKLSLVASPLSEEEIKLAIIEQWKEKAPKVASRRCFENLKLNISPSLSKKELAELSDDQEKFADELANACGEELKKAASALGGESVRKAVNLAFNECQAATDSNDLSAILKLMPGKDLIGCILEFTGCSDPDSLVRAITKHVKPTEIPELQDLRSSLRKSFGIAD